MKLLQSAIITTLLLPVEGCLLPEERQAERERALHGEPLSEPNFTLTKRQPANYGFPVGKGDRFRNGQVVPVGIGADNRTFPSILNMQEAASALQGLQNAYPDVRLFTPPHKTFEGRTVHGLAVGEEPRVYIQGGIHARERGATDSVIYLVADLLYARRHGGGLTYGDRTYSHDDVLKALSAGVAIVPALNPDGISYDQRSNACWRKNRNTTFEEEGRPNTVGVDLNRNYDFLWHYEKDFNSSASLGEIASSNPASSIFHGGSPASEAEVRNSAWTMHHFGNLSWFIDVHSFSGVVLYIWGDDNPQTTRPYENFMNATYNGKRGFLNKDPPGSQYKEYIEADDLASQNETASRMAGAMSLAAETFAYATSPVASFYAVSGASNDYAMSMYYGHRCGANRVQGVGVEFGHDSGLHPCPFYPTADQFHSSMRQMGAGLMELLLTAAGEAGEVKRWEC